MRWLIEFGAWVLWLAALWVSPPTVRPWIAGPGVVLLVGRVFGLAGVLDGGPWALVKGLVLFFVVLPLAGEALFTYVPGSSGWFKANVLPFIEWAKGRLSTEGVERLVSGAVGVFMAPAVWLISRAFGALGIHSNPYHWGPSGNVVLAFTLFLSWVIWSTAVSRSLRFVGLFDPFWRSSSVGRRWVLQGFIRLQEWWEALRKFGRGPTSGWAGFLEVLSERFVEGDIFLGRPKLLVGGMLRPVGIPTEKHVVTIGSPGSGKSTAALVPNLCIHRGSLLCVDPKGELAAVTAARRGQGKGVSGLGQSVYVLDPFGIVPGFQTAAYNVFDEVSRVAGYDADRAVSYAGKIAEALVKGESRDVYWDNAAKTFLRGLVLFILVHDPPEKRSLVRLRQLLMEGDLDGYAEAVEAGAIEASDPDMTPFDVLLQEMKAARKGPYGEVISAAASSLLMMGDNQRGGVLTTAQEHTAFLDVPEIQKVSKRSDFLLEDLKRGTISVYLCLPINMVSGKEGRWLRMFVLLLVDMMMRVQEAPKPPILLAIDEFPSLGRLDGIEVVGPVLRSYGVRLWVLGQDIEQFEKVYPGIWGGFFGNAEAVQFMGVTHPATVAYIVERLGTHAVSESVRGFGGQAEKREKVVPLLDADQVGRLLSKERKNQIVWRGSKRPMLLKTAPYFDYLPSWYYSADRRFRESFRRRVWRWFR
jgi:type IV secretion system protein VirD4